MGGQDVPSIYLCPWAELPCRIIRQSSNGPLASMAMSSASEVNWHNTENMQKAAVPVTLYDNVNEHLSSPQKPGTLKNQRA